MNEVVRAARGWIGTPYRHQASLRGTGCDCLGLLRGVWRDLYGPEPAPVPAYTPDWGEFGAGEPLWQAACAHLRATQDEAPGDVLLFRMRRGAVAKHIGIAGRVGTAASVIHACSGRGVVETALTPLWRRRLVARFAFPERSR